jgi:chromosome segregation ATPase
MDEIKNLERRLKIALDRISEGLENHAQAGDVDSTTEALQSEINALSDQNTKLSGLLADLEKERQEETEEMQKLYDQLAQVLNGSGNSLEENA